MKAHQIGMTLFLSILSILLGVNTSLGNQLARSVASSTENEAPLSELKQLRVVGTDLQPIAGAVVLLGNELDSPFKDNVVLTDENGIVDIPVAWDQTLSVTLEAPGYIRTTYLRVEPTPQTFELRKTEGKDFIEVKGTTTDYGRLRTDGYIDFSLVIPAFTQRSIIDFDISSVISPESDVISVAGQRIALPSNISLPRQSESYIIPITLDKPIYRSYVRDPGFYKIFATHGRFPFKRVVDKLRNGNSIFDIINDFEFLGGGQKDLQIDKSVTHQDISIRQIAFDQSFEIKAPNYAQNLEMISLAMVNQGGYFYPADLKRVPARGNIRLKYPASQKDTYVLSALMDKNAIPVDAHRELESIEFDKVLDLKRLFMFPHNDLYSLQNIAKGKGPGLALSLSFERPTSNSTISFLDFAAPPRHVDDTIHLTPPTVQSEIASVATYITLSEIESIGSGQVTTEKRTTLWELLAEGWIQQANLPHLPMDLRPNKSYRWEVLYLGQKGFRASTGGHLLDGITHISRSSINF